VTESDEYVWGTTLTEQQRLLKQTELYEPEANWLLEKLDIEASWRTVDVGCGPLGILDLLAGRVGSGEVIGLELEPHLVDMARKLITQRHLNNVRVVQGNANTSALPQESFDLVHERLLLIVVPEPQRVVAELVRLARPGGVVALEDVDVCSWICEPPHPAWTRLYSAFETIYREDGGDPYIGRRITGLLRSAGVEDVHSHVHGRINGPGDFHQEQLLLFIDLFRTKIQARGLLTESELTDLSEQLRAHLADPGTLVVSPLLFQAWGRKPHFSGYLAKNDANRSAAP